MINNIRNYILDELINELTQIGEKTFRAKQIYEWLHKHKILSFDEASNISKELKNKLTDIFDLSFPEIDREFISIDGTKKYLIKLHDGHKIETVLMKYKYGYSICISSEVGCDMGCKFCASTIGGMKRNLEVYELLAQIYLIEKHNDIEVSNIVIMGTGEPLCNFNNIIIFLSIINSKEGKNISLRNVTISTCGIVESINRLADMNYQLTLALSLHAPNQKIREKIMPIASRYDIKEVMIAMANYFIKTGRRITFEYCLIKNVNDNMDNAKELIELFKNSFKGKHIDFNVNLIPVNAVKETGLKRPEVDRINKFKDILLENKINVTIRRELGADISGSCGQLRAKIK